MGACFTAMGNVFIPHPLAAIIPGALFAIAAGVVRKKVLFLGAAAWTAYSVYEYLMKIRVLCSGECDIRIDLLAIYPALVLITLAASFAVLRQVALQTRSKES